MRREVATVMRYSLQSMREAWFRLTYEVREGPRPGTEQWFLVGNGRAFGIRASRVIRRQGMLHLHLR